MVDERHEDAFEEQLTQRLRRHADTAANSVDPTSVLQQLRTTPRRRSRRVFTAAAALTVVLASLLTVGVLQLVPAGAEKTADRVAIGLTNPGGAG